MRRLGLSAGFSGQGVWGGVHAYLFEHQSSWFSKTPEDLLLFAKGIAGESNVITSGFPATLGCVVWPNIS